MKTQRGAAMVEFALIALLFFMVLFGIIEFARAFFTYNTLVEATRRGARIAAVCPVTPTGILQAQQATVFDNTPDGVTTPTSGLLGLTTDDVVINYLDGNMNSIADNNNPIASIFDEDYDNIRFVRVQIQSLNNSNTIQLLIPGISVAFPVPPIVTTLPSESLGRISPENPITKRCCYDLDHTGAACTIP